MNGDIGLRIFISYTEVDIEWAKLVHSKIEERGHTPVMQYWDSPLGDNFVLWINEQIEKADIVLPLYSAQYFESRWCTIEWTTALTLKKLMIPIKIGSCELPAVLQNVTFVDFTGRSEKNVNQLLERGLTVQDRSWGESRTIASREEQAEAMVKRWKKVAKLAFVLGLIGTSVVFIPGGPGDPGGAGEAAGGIGWDFFP